PASARARRWIEFFARGGEWVPRAPVATHRPWAAGCPYPPQVLDVAHEGANTASGLEAARRSDSPFQRTGLEYAAEPGNDASRRDHPGAGGGGEALGGHRAGGAGRKDGRAPPRRPGERYLRGPGPGTDAVGRGTGVRRRGGRGRLHLRPAVRPASGNQRQP